MSTDSNIHESIKHLGYAHMLVETFAIAHHNTYECINKQMKGSKLIGLLLGHHFTDLIALNTAARVTLIAPINN